MSCFYIHWGSVTLQDQNHSIIIYFICPFILMNHELNGTKMHLKYLSLAGMQQENNLPNVISFVEIFNPKDDSNRANKYKCLRIQQMHARWYMLWTTKRSSIYHLLLREVLTFSLSMKL